MATFTAAPQCCLMDSSLAGASICVSISAGCSFGTEGKSLHWWEKLRETFPNSDIKCVCFCALLKRDDCRTGFSLPGHLHKLLHDRLHLPWTSYLWSLAPEVPQSRPVAPPCAGSYDKWTVFALLSVCAKVLISHVAGYMSRFWSHAASALSKLSKLTNTLIPYLQVQNGVMIYTTWTTIATLINLTIVLTYDVKMSPVDAATISYSILAVVLLVW